MKTGIHPKVWRRGKAFLAEPYALLVILLPLLANLAFSQQLHPTDSQVKAAYLYNFGKFVTWPAPRGADAGDFAICILGKDPFGEVLDATVNGESVDGKKIHILRIAAIQEARSCNILFVSSSEEVRLPAILAAAQRMNLLTVSDMKHFAERGGAIGLVDQHDRIRFEVNRGAAEQCHLTLSSELLKVAVRVIANNGPGS